MRRDQQRLEDILEAIGRIEKYSGTGSEESRSDELIQTWVIHHLEIIGEAVRGLSEEFRSEHSEVPWGRIAGMRNILVHDYFGIDLEEVWVAVEKDVPVLKEQVRRYLEP